MRAEVVEYIHLPSGSTLPSTIPQPRRTIVLSEQAVTKEWQDLVSDWIVESGCLYMMAWGIACSSWNDSVDWALFRRHDFNDVPDDQFVMTTWHDNEPLSEVFFHALMCAFHPTIDLQRVTIIHIAEEESRKTIMKAYADERAALHR